MKSQAVAKTLAANSDAQVAARRAVQAKLSVQLARSAIAALTTCLGLYYSCHGGRFPWQNSLSAAAAAATTASSAASSAASSSSSSSSSLPSVGTLAIYVPALVGAFEFSQGLAELLRLNEYYLQMVKLRVVNTALRYSSYAVSPLLWALRTAVTAGLAAADKSGRLLLAADLKVVGPGTLLGGEGGLDLRDGASRFLSSTTG